MVSARAASTGQSQVLPGRLATLALLLTLIVSATGCAAVSGIFKAGLWVGLILAVLVIAVVFFVVRRVSR